MLKIFLAWFVLAFSASAMAEQGCPPGQYPIGGQGVAACAPMPQASPPPPRPTGKWLKTWGAIALGAIDSTPYYGVPTGLNSKTEAENEALTRCRKVGAQGCIIKISYRNQCAAIGEPQIDGNPDPNGYIQFTSQSTKKGAADEALNNCKARNPSMQCKVIYSACSEPIFEKF
ncbi:DUF4189 domain-containing protein [Xanthomonas arboricola]|uniref:DUF4189 domain-containing protein n=1 Tax=Xanthomonas arboricola TaxID=56448 RepID=UPI002B2F2EB8|nr:DUF4189 domain-containing protein [Xanthomonas arboricola]